MNLEPPRPTTPRGIDTTDLRNRFGYHPATATSAPKHEAARELFFELADWCAATVPAGRELSTCITKLEEAMMWANAGIARVEPLG